MDCWHSKTFADALEACALQTLLLAHFVDVESLKNRARDDPEFAVFKRLNRATGEITLYFPPETWGLVNVVRATPCEKPERAGMTTFLASQQASLGHYFPA